MDFRIQYALHTTSFEEQPLSEKTLSRFRKRCYDYERLHNQDLYHDCVKDLSTAIAKIMNINGRIRRMDSMMIESNIRKLSRMELIYTYIAKLAVYIEKSTGTTLPEELEHYTDSNDFNKVIFHQRSTDAEIRMKRDSSFLKDHLEQMEKQEEPVSLVTDGAYSGMDNTKLAENKNVELINLYETKQSVQCFF